MGSPALMSGTATNKATGKLFMLIESIPEPPIGHSFCWASTAVGSQNSQITALGIDKVWVRTHETSAGLNNVCFALSTCQLCTTMWKLKMTWVRIWVLTLRGVKVF